MPETDWPVLYPRTGLEMLHNPFGLSLLCLKAKVRTKGNDVQTVTSKTHLTVVPGVRSEDQD